MEINGKASLLVPPPTAPIKEESRGAVVSSDGEGPSGRDTVDISTGASQMVRKINALPDVREDRVAELKRRIASGTYRVVNEQIASHMIGETVENNAILNRIDALDD